MYAYLQHIFKHMFAQLITLYIVMISVFIRLKAHDT